jgi:quinol-cytochrome oxidoreductase complex cytochrome b subunit
LRGGEDVTGATVTRFFGFHVALLPGVTTILILVHLALVQRFGISVPPEVEARWKAEPSHAREMKFFPGFFLRELMAWYLALAALGTLAALSPWELGTKADSFAPAPAGIRPEWYFMFMFQTLKLIPSKLWRVDGEVLGILVFGVAAVVWLLLPFLEGLREHRGRKLVVGAGVFALAYMVTLTVYGYLAK